MVVPAGRRRELRPFEVRPVAVKFAVRRSLPPARLDGTIVASLSPIRRSSPLTVAVTGSARPIAGVTVAPTAITLRVTRVWPFRKQFGHEATVRLRGPGIGDALGRMDTDQSVVLRNGEGNQLLVVMRDLRPMSPTEAQATVFIRDSAAVGAYAGTLPLSRSAEAPAVDLSVEARHPLPWAIFVVFGGSVLGGYALPRWRLRRRKESLLRDLKDAVAEYDRERGQRAQRPAAWSLDRRLGPRPPGQSRWDADMRGVAEFEGVVGLAWRIQHALTPNDVEGDRVEANAIIDDIGRWLTVERAAKRLRSQVHKAPADRPGHSWRDTRVWRVTQELLVSIRRAPSPDTDVNAVADNLDRQRELYSSYRDLWNARYALETQLGLPPEPAAAIAALDIDALNEEFPESGLPTEADYDDLLVKVITAHDKVFSGDFQRRSLDKLLHLAPKENLGPAPPAERVKPEEMGPFASAALSAAAVTAGVVVPGAGSIAGDFVADALRAWRRRPARSEQTEKRTAASTTVGQGAASVQRPPRRRRRKGRFLAWTYRRDVLWTLLGALVGVIVYVLTIYDSTWGSAADYLAAFATGFGTSTIVRWADLPGSDSLRRTEPVPGARPAAAPGR